MQVLLAAFAYFADPAVVPLPILKIDGFKNNPVLLSLFSGYSLLEILAPVVVFLLSGFPLSHSMGIAFAQCWAQ